MAGLYIPRHYLDSFHHGLWSVLIFAVVLVKGDTFPIPVETTHGLVQGIREGNSDVFWGVPYAAPPVGPLRWKNPQPLEAWEPSVLDATRIPPGCTQICEDVSFTCPSEVSTRTWLVAKQNFVLWNTNCWYLRSSDVHHLMVYLY